MKKKTKISANFAGIFAVWIILLFSASFVSAQCGSYFKTNYRVINKYATTSLPTVGLDDWTGDGKSDYWNLRRDSTTSFLEIVIFPSKPTGYWDFDNPLIYTTTNQNISGELKVIDFDSDGKKDLLYGGEDYIYKVLHNNGNNTMTASSALTDSGLVSNSSIGFADLNGDNLLDWVYYVILGSNPNLTYELRYQLQNPDGTFAAKTTILTGTPENYFGTSNKKLGDFNGDGKIDIIYSGYIGNGESIYVMIKNLGNGSFQVGTPVPDALYIKPGPATDFNNDGKEDILSGSRIFYGQADGTFTRTQLDFAADTTVAAELNGDNNLDVIEMGTNSYATYINDGAGGFSRTFYEKSFVQTNFATSNGWKFEDFSGDGKADFYDARSVNSNYTSNYTYNIFGERLLSIKENVCQPFGETKMADFDRNFNADVMMWNSDTGNWSLKNARWGFEVDPNTRTFNWGLGSLSDIPAPGDFDGDGMTDYAVYRNSTGVWYILKSSDSSWMVLQFGLTGDIAVPNDYNDGGKTDIAVFRPSDGNWYIWFSETQEFQAVHFGASGDKPVPADYDGDGKTDVAVYRPSDGNWYYLKSSDGNFVVTRWGIETDKPVPADYDGDGRADLTVYRDGVWWIRRSSNGLPTAIKWGATGDIPVPVYRNSISADMTFYRPSNNLWHSLDYRNYQGFTLGENSSVPVYFGLPNN